MRTSRRPPLPLAVGAALAVAAFVSLLVMGQPQIRGQTPLLSEDEAAVLALINDYRLEHGLSTLKVSPTLSAAARWMSEDMAQNNYLDHTDSLGRDPWERMAAFSYTQASLWGEIIRAGGTTPQDAFEGWRSSPGHNAIMLTDGFVVGGVGQAYNPQSLYGWFWTVDFGDYDDSGVPLPTPTSMPTPTLTPTPAPTPTPEVEPRALVWSVHPESSQADDATMHNCPQAGKWSVATWSGQYAVPIKEALASCSQQVDVAYRINPDTQTWIRYIRDRPEISDLIAIDDGQGIIAWSAAVAAASTEGGWPQTGGGDKPSSEGFEDDIASASSGETSQIPDPAFVYCYELGYGSKTAEKPEGQYGICIFPDGSECDEWGFLEGKCGESYSYCARHGYGQITKTDGKNPYSGDYAVCVHDQEEIGAVTELMGLSELFAGGMLGCPQAGKWAIAVWGGADGTPIDQAVASCTEASVAAAYWIDPQTQAWERWFPAQPEISSLTTLDEMQAIIAFGGEKARPAPSPTLTCTYHVASTGNDADPGTAEAPWLTIQHAADAAQPGDTVCVGSGSYSEDVTFSRSGTADAAVTFAAAPGETATVQGSLTLAAGTSYLNLIGFAVLGFPVWGVTLEGNNHHVLLSHLDVAGGEAGVRFTVGYSGEDPEHGLVSELVLEDSVIRDSVYTAVDCTPGPCNGTTFRRLEISGSGLAAGFGGDGLGVERGQDILVEDCFIHDNGGDGIDLNSRDSAGNVPGIVVRRNRVVGNQLQGIKLWAGGRMENNVVWGQGINPVMVGVYPGVYRVVNNTIAYNMYSPDYGARDYAFVAAYPENGTSAAIQLTLVNNIFAFNTGPEQGTPTGLYLGEGVQLTEHHNLYWSREDGEIEAEFVSERDPWFTRAEIADGTWAAVTGWGQGDVTADPLFASGWSDVDLHLQASSPAVDAGCPDAAPSDDAEGRPREAAPDIGAYER